MKAQRERSLWRPSILIAAVALLPAWAMAASLTLNGVPIGKVDLSVQGLDGVTFEKCSSVRVDKSGDVRIECPGYDLQTSGQTPSATPLEPIVPGRITKRYWVVSEQTDPGATAFDVDVYVNSKWLKRFRNDDEPIVLEITKHLSPGMNKILFAPARSTAAQRRVPNPKFQYRFVVGEGESSGGHVVIDQPLFEMKLTAADTSAAPRNFELMAR